ncbi:hypothetical protein KP509_24G079100 [Ceratopteris richardii]|uniref:non-specific serine/threonine protein kinase n=1 Tax=Ceratopteris richardii TaxID=49495 RepID=A0A8T2RYM1_CERRI|nr:hypothetical protein KP509_24G079100 [Ceratopteris richardii]
MGNCLPLNFVKIPAFLGIPSSFFPFPQDASAAARTRRRSAPSLAHPLSSSVLQRRTEDFRELFEIGRKLGQGQFGTTYLCIEKSSGIQYACKFIEKRKLVSREDVEDVRTEIHIMHHLAGSPHIVTIYGAFEDSSYVYLVMELCNGGELFDRIVQRGHYSEREAARLINIIVSVVECCHSHGVIHRDLKPENFLFVNDQETSPLKAIDFGLSSFFQPGQVFRDVVGSPYYVAPEVLQRSYGPEVDVWSAGVILYILLSGVPPYWAETEQGIFYQVRYGVLDFSSEPWPHISENAKDLVRGMLNRDPGKRLTAHEVLSHPWICEDGVAPDRPLDPAILSRMKQFMAMNKMKKVALRFIAETLAEEEIAGLKETFKMMDTDGSGSITFDELKTGLERMGSGLLDNEVRVLMKAADIDNNGSLDYEEFIAATVHYNKLHKEENLAAAFAYFDKDNSGYITRDEIWQACHDHGVDDPEIQDIIKEIDQNNDGCIDYGEFVSMMRKGSGGHSRRALQVQLENGNRGQKIE